jgi:hypothetical protein
MSKPTDPDKNGASGSRDPKTGRFVHGNSGGPGRPKGTLQIRRLVEKEIWKRQPPASQLESSTGAMS